MKGVIVLFGILAVSSLGIFTTASAAPKYTIEECTYLWEKNEGKLDDATRQRYWKDCLKASCKEPVPVAAAVASRGKEAVQACSNHPVCLKGCQRVATSEKGSLPAVRCKQTHRTRQSDART